MKVVAKFFGHEKDVENEAQQQSGIATDLILLSKLYPLITENEAYNPYCKICYEHDVKFKPGCTVIPRGPDILYTSTVCFSSEW